MTLALLLACASGAPPSDAQAPPRALLEAPARTVAPTVTPVEAPPVRPEGCDPALARLAQALARAQESAATSGIEEARALARAQDALARCNADPACAGDPKQRAARFVDVHEAEVALDAARRPLAEADAAVYVARAAADAACGGAR